MLIAAVLKMSIESGGEIRKSFYKKEVKEPLGYLKKKIIDLVQDMI